MNAETVFRQANAGDFAALAALRWDARAEGQDERPLVGRTEFAQACVAFLRQGLAQGDRASFVAAQGSHLIAHLAIQRIRLFPRPVKIDDQMGLIIENYTRPPYRNGGIGSRLLQLGIDWARQQDFELLIVYPSTKAVPFYERAGFTAGSDVMELKLRDYTSPDWAGPV